MFDGMHMKDNNTNISSDSNGDSFAEQSSGFSFMSSTAPPEPVANEEVSSFSFMSAGASEGATNKGVSSFSFMSEPYQPENHVMDTEVCLFL